MTAKGKSLRSRGKRFLSILSDAVGRGATVPLHLPFLKYSTGVAGV